MSDQINDLILVTLHHIDDRADRIEQRVNAMDLRLGQLQLRVAELASDVVSNWLNLHTPD